MRAPLAGLPFVCTGTDGVVEAAADVLEALGAQVIRVPVVHGPVHAQRIEALEPIGAIDATRSLGEPPFPVLRLVPVDAASAWAASGALALTGPGAGAPVACDPRIATRLLGAGAVSQLLAACREVTLNLDPLALLGERAAIAGFGRRGGSSVGGNAHLVRAADGWIALNLARGDDLAALPALLDGDVASDAPWHEVEAAIRVRTRAQLGVQARLLSLPLGEVPEPGERKRPASPYVIGDPAVGERTARLRPEHVVDAQPAPRTSLVIDLSSLWAGPLAASLVGQCGARVIKVEGATRPDGARRGPAAFFDLLNFDKECVALDFADGRDIALLRRLVERADVVIEGSRPRVMDALGIDPMTVALDHNTAWISITGHGRYGVDAQRVAFGDDAAAAAGLVVGEPPMFVADAGADPITALYATCAAMAALVGNRGQVIDVSLRRCAAYVGGDALPIGTEWNGSVAAPHAREVRGSARAHGADTSAIRAEFAE